MAAHQDSGQELLDRAFDRLEEHTSDRITRALEWIRSPSSRWVRIPLGILCIAASFFFWLPVLGLWLLPIGLLLVAQDVPFIRKPIARFMLWLEDKWEQRQRSRKR